MRKALYQAIDWCKENISKVSYYIPGASSTYQGGEGWGFRYEGNMTYVTIDDEKLLVMFLLLFSSPNIKVDTSDVKIYTDRFKI